MTKGTLLVVWEVFSPPCSLSISSALLLRGGRRVEMLAVAGEASEGGLYGNAGGVYGNGEEWTGLPMISRDEQNVTFLLALLKDLADCLVGGFDSLDRWAVLPCVTNHVRRRKVVHEELVLLVSNTLA